MALLQSAYRLPQFGWSNPLQYTSRWGFFRLTSCISVPAWLFWAPDRASPWPWAYSPMVRNVNIPYSKAAAVFANICNHVMDQWHQIFQFFKQNWKFVFLCKIFPFSNVSYQFTFFFFLMLWQPNKIPVNYQPCLPVIIFPWTAGKKSMSESLRYLSSPTKAPFLEMLV